MSHSMREWESAIEAMWLKRALRVEYLKILRKSREDILYTAAGLIESESYDGLQVGRQKDNDIMQMQ